jgi:hypothetical protein
VLKDKNLPLKLRFLPHDAKPALTESQLEYFEDAIDVWISRASTAAAQKRSQKGKPKPAKPPMPVKIHAAEAAAELFKRHRLNPTAWPNSRFVQLPAAICFDGPVQAHNCGLPASGSSVLSTSCLHRGCHGVDHHSAIRWIDS